MILTRIVTSFSPPGGHIALLDWPTHARRPHAATPRTAAAPDRTRTTESGPDVVDALATIHALDRTGHMLQPTQAPADVGAASRPFWADLVNDPDRSPAGSAHRNASANVLELNGAADLPRELDLIITALNPEHAGEACSDHVALLANRLLASGGILAVLTHCDWTTGLLVDPTGTMVASAQNADLLYLQHVVALHTPVVDGQLSTNGLDPTPDEQQHDDHTKQAEASVHRRIHSDVLVFANPGPPAPSRQTSVETIAATGARR